MIWINVPSNSRFTRDMFLFIVSFITLIPFSPILLPVFHYHFESNVHQCKEVFGLMLPLSERWVNDVLCWSVSQSLRAPSSSILLSIQVWLVKCLSSFNGTMTNHSFSIPLIWCFLEELQQSLLHHHYLWCYLFENHSHHIVFIVFETITSIPTIKI